MEWVCRPSVEERNKVKPCGVKSDTTCYRNDVEIDRYGEEESVSLVFLLLLSVFFSFFFFFLLSSFPLSSLFSRFVRNFSLTTRNEHRTPSIRSSHREAIVGFSFLWKKLERDRRKKENVQRNFIEREPRPTLAIAEKPLSANRSDRPNSRTAVYPFDLRFHLASRLY